MKAEHDWLATPEQNYEEAAWELALYRLILHERDTVKANMTQEDEAQIQRLAEKNTPHILKMMGQQAKRGRRTHFRSGYGIRIFKAAAFMILMMNMALTIAAASNGYVRAKVIQFLTEINESYMEMGFVECEDAVNLPESWQASFYPTYIPKGYELLVSNANDAISEAEYVDDQGNRLTIRVCGTTAFGRLNTENAEIVQTEVGGIPAILLRQPYDETHMLWANGDHSFFVGGPDDETVRQVAESIRLIRK